MTLPLCCRHAENYAYAGHSTRALLLKCTDIIMGLGYTMSKSGRELDKVLARETLEHGLMAECFTGRHQIAMLAASLCQGVSQQQTMAVPACRRPFDQEIWMSQSFVMC